MASALEHRFDFNEAVSPQVMKDQDEVDHHWDKLSGGGERPCGWLKDRFGVSLQVVPQPFIELVESGDPEASARAFQAMLEMKKLDIAALQAAYAGRVGNDRPKIASAGPARGRLPHLVIGRVELGLVAGPVPLDEPVGEETDQQRLMQGDDAEVVYQVAWVGQLVGLEEPMERPGDGLHLVGEDHVGDADHAEPPDGGDAPPTPRPVAGALRRPSALAAGDEGDDGEDDERHLHEEGAEELRVDEGVRSDRERIGDRPLGEEDRPERPQQIPVRFDERGWLGHVVGAVERWRHDGDEGEDGAHHEGDEGPVADQFVAEAEPLHRLLFLGRPFLLLELLLGFDVEVGEFSQFHAVHS